MKFRLSSGLFCLAVIILPVWALSQTPARRPRVIIPKPRPTVTPRRTPAPTPTPRPPGTRPRTTQPVTTVSETRALWVVRTTLTTPDKIRKMVSDAANAGFNTLIVQVRGRGDAYYQSRWEPRADALKGQPATFDPLAFTIAEAQRRRLKVHAWINTHLIADLDSLPADPQHIYNARPEWLAVPRDLGADLYNLPPTDQRYRARIVEWSKRNKQELEGLYTSPANPAVREHIYSIWLEVLEKYPLDGLHFDYIRYASPAFDYSRTSIERFRDWLDPHLSSEENRVLIEATRANPLAATELFPERFAEFQREQVTSLVERISLAARKRKPQLTISAAVFANSKDAYERRFQDWQRWLSLGFLDVVCPMAYTTETPTFRQQIEAATNAAHSNGAKVWAGIGAYRLPVDGTVEKIKAARELGADGISLFSYDFTATISQPNNPKGDYLKQIQAKAFGN